MQISNSSRYWVFQVFGWCFFTLINLFFAFIFDQIDVHGILICRLVFFVEVGLIVSHLMRTTISRNNLLIRPINQQIILFLILTLLFAVIVALAQALFEYNYGLRLMNGERAPFHIIYYTNLYTSFILLFIWNSIYFMYHYV